MAHRCTARLPAQRQLQQRASGRWQTPSAPRRAPWRCLLCTSYCHTQAVRASGAALSCTLTRGAWRSASHSSVRQRGYATCHLFML